MLLPTSSVARLSSTALQSSTAPMIVVAEYGSDLLRGGAAAALDIGRTKMRLEGLNQYGVMTALLMNAALRLYSSTPRKIDPNNTKTENILRMVFATTVAMCICLGGYTTIVFSLLGLYSKRALGLGQDIEYLEFFSATSDVRRSGFESFIWCLLLFKSSFLLSVFLNQDGKARWWLSGVILAFDLFGWFQWSKIWLLAKSILHLTTPGSM